MKLLRNDHQLKESRLFIRFRSAESSFPTFRRVTCRSCSSSCTPVASASPKMSKTLSENFLKTFCRSTLRSGINIIKRISVHDYSTKRNCAILMFDLIFAPNLLIIHQNLAVTCDSTVMSATVITFYSIAHCLPSTNLLSPSARSTRHDRDDGGDSNGFDASGTNIENPP